MSPQPALFLLACWLLALPGVSQSPREKLPTRKPTTVQVGDLGAVTRAPTTDEVEQLKLPFAVRAQGQVVTKVREAGPSEAAGLAAGDVVLALDTNKIFSRDDIEDFLRVTRPGSKVKAEVVRATTGKRAALTITLGGRSVAKSSGIVWKHAGLEQLESVIKLARDDRKRILIGLSGAET